MAYPVLQGDQTSLLVVSSVVVSVRAWVDVRYDNGQIGRLLIPQTNTLSDRSVETFVSRNVASRDGEVIASVVETFASGSRGQTWTRLDIHENVLSEGYLYRGRKIPLGLFEMTGPGGGGGHLRWVSLASDIAPVDVTRVLGVANALRKIHGFVWYYNAAAVAATRTLRASVRNAGLALPTGMTAGANTTQWFNRAEMSLTTGEEGTISVLPPSYESDVDNGVITVGALNAGGKDFWPYWATEDDLAELFFDVGSANASDRHSIYLLQEEWIVL